MARSHSIRHQLLVLGLLATGSIWVGALLQYVQLREQEVFLREVRQSLAMARLYSQAVRHAGRERGLSNGWLLGAPDGPPGSAPIPPEPLRRERDALDEAFEALTRRVSGPAVIAVAEPRAALTHHRTLVDRRAAPAAAVFAGYTRLIADIQGVAARELADGMRAVNLPYEHVNHIARAAEELAQVRGLTYGVLSQGALEDGQRLELNRR